jgi:hypothetical protein
MPVVAPCRTGGDENLFNVFHDEIVRCDMSVQSELTMKAEIIAASVV